MKSSRIEGAIAINIEYIAATIQWLLPISTAIFIGLGLHLHPAWTWLGGAMVIVTLSDQYLRRVQRKHILLTNFGILGQLRYMIESIGPEFRQYLFLSDVEERPFNRIQRSEVYRKAKGLDDSSAFGTKRAFDGSEWKILHAAFPLPKSETKRFSLSFGEERQLKNTHTINHPLMISAMSYGALGQRAVRALARGAHKSGLTMNTGEGGYPDYHLKENCDLIFQIGTAKFGVRTAEGLLNPEKLKAIADLPQVKMIELKLSQGAKPGKGGLLPKEKITAEIARLRGVEPSRDVISPPSHPECQDPKSLANFVSHIQDITALPVGIKLCAGKRSDLQDLVQAFVAQDRFPDYIAIDGGEGGTGAAPTSFLDDVGTPILESLPMLIDILEKAGCRNRLKVVASGKLINPGSQFIAMALGADAVYCARGFMLALGCIQALQCHKNSCPVGITTHKPKLQRGLDIEQRSDRIENYARAVEHDLRELLAATGKRSFSELSREDVSAPTR